MSEQTKDGGQDLHARIINLPVKPGLAMASASESHILTYKIGHRDARHAAAELAAGQEHALHLARSRILELEQALGELIEAERALKVERLDLWADNRTKRMNAAMNRASKAETAARSVLNKENGNPSDGDRDA